MPTYDYECSVCGKRIAVEQSIKDKPLRKCPKCGGKLEKLLPQTVNLIFRGSGFYITDYKRSGESSQKSEGKREKPDDGQKQ